MRQHKEMGFGRARVIRELHSARCNAEEIAAYLNVETGEVRRTINRPVPCRAIFAERCMIESKNRARASNGTYLKTERAPG